MKPVIIVSTFPSKQSVTSIANKLVKKKLAACVNITKISSVYAWKGKIENQAEYLALFKTSKNNKSKLKKELQKLHPYDIPEIAEINVDSINQPYLKWLVDSTS
uniref:Periplasmic divalent cation tolerance protein (CutA) n=2 Tax=environmental samples TaxID=651140 RepID=A0A075H8L5_9ARCH|nr:periplasmic divalent cation tolerance protein (cutA) [uncultured marine thaumarchaeote KM3_57_F01]AIF12891.1 periplasmic divalent cation tolerance protein (cutA) [uncultured marine thaumarchaeote KM3_57_F02]